MRILIALSHTIWYTKGKHRRIPIWIDKNGFFAYKLAFAIAPERT